MKSFVSWGCLFALALAMPVQAQTRLPKPEFSKPTVYMPGPAALSASSALGRVTLIFPPVTNAQAYRVTRASSLAELNGAGEVIVYEGATTTFDASRGSCWPVPPVGTTPRCEYTDNKVSMNFTYTYRIWAIYPGPVVSSPSPSTTIRVQ